MIELHDSRDGIIYRWHGSHTVNIYNADGVEIDCFTFGFNADGSSPTLEEFAAAVNRRRDYL